MRASREYLRLALSSARCPKFMVPCAPRDTHLRAIIIVHTFASLPRIERRDVAG